MNCNDHRFELSQCLDGRLPAGRRSAVLQHAAECGGCGAFWADLQKAQQLTRRLHAPRVGADFRESLFARIESGEGTPEAVFREPVPLLAKARYALTGAAAAAALIVGALWLTPGGGASPMAQPIVDARPTTLHQDAAPAMSPPLLAATQPLGFHLVAREAARQLDQRYDAAATAMRRVEAGDDRAVASVFENADEVHALGELLLDLRDRKRLLFTESDVEPDLRFAVRMLGESRRSRRDAQTAQSMVAPALRSNRLAAVSRTIAPVQLERGEEIDVLQRLTAQRPDIFPKLFIVIGSGDALADDVTLLRAGAAFGNVDDCGPRWVAPRSEVEAREGMWRLLERAAVGVDPTAAPAALPGRRQPAGK
jgi:hypothetical protein